MDVKTFFDLSKLFKNQTFDPDRLVWYNVLIGIGIVAMIAVIADFITKKVFLKVVRRIAKRTSTQWDDIILEKNVFNRIAHLVPAFIAYYLLGFVFADERFASVLTLLKSAIGVYMVIMVLLAIDAFINSVLHIYNTLEISKNRPISGYIQVVKIIVYFVAIILIISIVFKQSPMTLLKGLGAMAAILILVFKDTILGFVASIQLSANEMLRIGDWISMPSHGADGTVLQITLNTVKVQNWDKTISTIPTYALVSESYNNWRGMEESGGRRIKRSITLDMKSVKFCTPEMLDRFKQIRFLKEYIENKQKEIEQYNKDNNIGEEIVVNGRRMTNIGTFRKYLEEYLKHHPKIHKEMTFLVRQLQPNEKGIGIEIYVFSSDKAWANYEAIQADIFDHVLAIIPEFELRVFQNPTGEDFQRMINLGV